MPGFPLFVQTSSQLSPPTPINQDVGSTVGPAVVGLNVVGLTLVGLAIVGALLGLPAIMGLHLHLTI